MKNAPKLAHSGGQRAQKKEALSLKNINKKKMPRDSCDDAFAQLSQSVG